MISGFCPEETVQPRWMLAQDDPTPSISLSNAVYQAIPSILSGGLRYRSPIKGGLVNSANHRSKVSGKIDLIDIVY